MSKFSLWMLSIVMLAKETQNSKYQFSFLFLIKNSCETWFGNNTNQLRESRKASVSLNLLSKPSIIIFQNTRFLLKTIKRKIWIWVESGFWVSLDATNPLERRIIDALDEAIDYLHLQRPWVTVEVFELSQTRQFLNLSIQIPLFLKCTLALLPIAFRH